MAGNVFVKIGMNMPGNHVISDAQKSIIKTMAGLKVPGRTNFAETVLVYAPETIRIYLDRLTKIK